MGCGCNSTEQLGTIWLNSSGEKGAQCPRQLRTSLVLVIENRIFPDYFKRSCGLPDTSHWTLRSKEGPKNTVLRDWLTQTRGLCRNGLLPGSDEAACFKSGYHNCLPPNMPVERNKNCLMRKPTSGQVQVLCERDRRSCWGSWGSTHPLFKWFSRGIALMTALRNLQCFCKVTGVAHAIHVHANSPALSLLVLFQLCTCQLQWLLVTGCGADAVYVSSGNSVGHGGLVCCYYNNNNLTVTLGLREVDSIYHLECSQSDCNHTFINSEREEVQSHWLTSHRQTFKVSKERWIITTLQARS